MPIKKGTFASSIAEVPTVTAQAASNYNQDRFTASAYVTANNSNTTVYFDYSTSSSFSSYTTVTHWVTVTGGPYLAYYNVSGLTANTTYYYRCRAVNAIGTTIGATNSFTTWRLITYLNTTAGSYSVSVPSITPYLDTAIAPTIYEMLIYGGGGGAANGAGGGGGYRIASSYQSGTTGTQNVTGTIGAGGAGGSTGAAGGNSTITVGSNTWTAGGGGGGGWLTSPAGSVGSGSNPAYGGGTGYYGVVYLSGYAQYCCGGTDKFGLCKGYCNDYSQPQYATDYNQYAGGGGGGTDSAGANGSGNVGGVGGAGGGAYGLKGGNGGGGQGSAGSNGAGSVPGWSGPVVGTGGTGYAGNGVAGGVTFKYYGP